MGGGASVFINRINSAICQWYSNWPGFRGVQEDYLPPSHFHALYGSTPLPLNSVLSPPLLYRYPISGLLALIRLREGGVLLPPLIIHIFENLNIRAPLDVIMYFECIILKTCISSVGCIAGVQCILFSTCRLHYTKCKKAPLCSLLKGPSTTSPINNGSL